MLRVEQVTPPQGLATEWGQLDRYLLWHGFPKAAVSLLSGDGGGATSLWIRSAALVTRRGQWAAWINDADSALTPWVLRQRRVNLARLLYVEAPRDGKQLLWVMQELMSLCLFETIGCVVGDTRLRDHQILKLKKLAMRYHTAVVLISPARVTAPEGGPFYSLVMQFGRDHVTVNRALHRPTPFLLERRDLYADTLPLLTAGRRALCG